MWQSTPTTSRLDSDRARSYCSTARPMSMPNLRLLHPGRDVGMGLRIDVGIDAQARPAPCRRACAATRSSSVELAGRLDVEHEDAVAQRVRHLVACLADAREHDLRRVGAGRRARKSSPPETMSKPAALAGEERAAPRGSSSPSPSSRRGAARPRTLRRRRGSGAAASPSCRRSTACRLRRRSSRAERPRRGARPPGSGNGSLVDRDRDHVGRLAVVLVERVADHAVVVARYPCVTDLSTYSKFFSGRKRSRSVTGTSAICSAC